MLYAKLQGDFSHVTVTYLLKTIMKGQGSRILIGFLKLQTLKIIKNVVNFYNMVSF